MKHLLFPPLLVCLLLSIENLPGEVVISEVQAANSQTLLDADGDSSDWLELYHSGSEPLSLEGYHLTDSEEDLTQWTFPPLSLEPGEFLVVFASGKDRRDPAGELHTNFRLNAAGEYLALVGPDGSKVVDAFAPAFSGMNDDESYGRPFQGTFYVGRETPASFSVPENDASGLSWAEPDFAAGASWTGAAVPLGFGEGSGPTQDGLVAYYDFEEGGGTTLLDKSGRAHHGTLRNMNASSDWVSGQAGLGLALDFDGNNDHVSLVSPSALGLDGDFTASAWVRLDDVNGDNTILGQDAQGLHLATRDNKAYFGFWGNDTSGGTQVIRPSQWTHLAWRFRSGEQAIFVNGEWDNATGGHAALGNGATVALGRSNGNQGWFNGRMDEVAIFDRALSDEDIEDLASGQPLSLGADLESQMKGRQASVYARFPFAVSRVEDVESLTLQMRYNDGFVAYLNGTEVARRHAPAAPAWNSAATSARGVGESGVWESFYLGERAHLLRVGTNVLAIHGLNASAEDPTFLLEPVLSAGMLEAGPAGILDSPTPGRANGVVTSLGKVADTKFSEDRGFFAAPFSLSLSTATSGARIRYTLDGSAPSPTRGSLYSGPIQVSRTTVVRAIAYRDQYEPSNVDTQSYFFVSDIRSQGSTPPQGWPQGEVNGQVLDYGMDSPAAIGTSAAALEGALLSLDSISVVTSADNLFDASDGIYVNAGRRGRAWERPASVELIRRDGADGFQMDAGLRIRGGFSRSGDNPKHAFRLFFREEYGGDLRYPLFGDEGVDRFENLDLRTAQNYSWSFQGGTRNTFVREVFARDAQAALGRAHTRSRYYHLYLNGIYWGLFMSQERAEASFGASYFGGDDDDYDVVKSAGSSGGYQIEATDGEMAGWEAFWERANQMAASSNANLRFQIYQELQGFNPDGSRNGNYPVYLDVENLIDYMLIVLFVGSYDAPVSNFLGNERPNNWFSVWNRSGEFGFQFFAHDCEHSLGTGSGSTITDRTGPWPAGQTLNYSNPQWIHQQLMAVDAYRLRFADRAHALLFQGGLLSPAATIARIDARAAVIDQAILAESARWGDSKRSNPLRRSDWLNAVDDVRNYLRSRPSVLVEQLKDARRYNRGQVSQGTTSAPLYPSVVAPAFNQKGGWVAEGFGLQFSAAGGEVYYTVNGGDPRLPSGAVANEAVRAEEGTILSTTLYRSEDGLRVRVPGNGNLGNAWRAPGFNDGSWTFGRGGVGYDENPTYASLIDVDVEGAMNNENTSIYIRCEFDVADAAGFQGLTLRLKFEDGFAAFLNGERVASFNAPSSLSWNSEATALHGDDEAQRFIEFDLTPHLDLLRSGENVVAIHGLNDNLGSSDFLCVPELLGTRVTGGSAVELDAGFAEINARALQNGEWSALSTVAFMVGTTPAVAPDLVITEIMYHPSAPSAAEIAAGFSDAGAFEYIELTNVGSGLLDLSGLQFVEGVSLVLAPGTEAVLRPGERVLVVSNRDAFVFRYGEEPRIAGVFAGSLNNGGETLRLLDAGSQPLQEVTFDDRLPWPEAADGLGASLILLDPSSRPDPSLAASWSASVDGGTPGTGDAVSVLEIWVNEVLTHTDWPQVDAVELYNPHPTPVEVGGWFLTDDPNTPNKYQIPAGTTVPAQGFLVLLEDNDADPENNDLLPPAFFGKVFSLSSAGDELYLYSADARGLTGYRDGFSFRGAVNGVSFGRWVNSAGEVGYPAQRQVSLGEANAGPRMPEVIINEVHYHPMEANGAEFVEVWNLSDQVVPLFHRDHPQYTWRLDGMDFDFPEGQELQPGELALVVGTDPDTFRSTHNLGAEMKIFGPAGGALDNGGERIELLRPDAPLIKGGEEVVPMVVVDAMTYDDVEPWPIAADGAGASLVRLETAAFGADPAFWAASTMSGGSPGSVAGRSVLTIKVEGEGRVELEPDRLQFEVGENVTLSALPADGWQFVRWGGSVQGEENPLAITVTEVVSVVAFFEPVPMTFTLATSVDGGGQIQVDPAAPTYPAGDTVTVSALPQPGFRFAGWEGDLSGAASPIPLIMDADKAISARFVEQVSLEISVAGPGAVTTDPSKAVFDRGESVTLTAQPDGEAFFAGWAGDAEGSENPLTVIMGGERTIEARFEARLRLEVNVDGPGRVTSQPQGVVHAPGTELSYTAIPDSGAAFVGWSGWIESPLNPLPLTLDRGGSLVAHFVTLIPLTVEVSGEGTVDLLPLGEVFLPGTEVALTPSAAPGWVFTGWRGALEGAEVPGRLALEVPSTVTAVFEPLLTVAIDGTEGGSVMISPQAPNYRRGEEITLSAVADEGHRFDRWEGDLSGREMSQSVTLAGNLTARAIFLPLPTLSVSTEGEGSVSRDLEKPFYEDGERVTLTAVPAEGWAFVRWQGAVDGEASPVTLVMGGNLSVTAIFAQTYPLTVDVRGIGAVGKEPNRERYVRGAEVTLTAVPGPAHRFVRWESEGGEDLGEASTLSVTVEAAQILTAVFEPIEEDPPYRSWAKDFFNEAGLADLTISGPNADPDKDRWPNILEYVTGTDPLDGRSVGQVEIHGNPGEPGVVAEVRVLLQRLEGVDYGLDVSMDLASWEDAGAGAGTEGGIRLVTAPTVEEGGRAVWQVLAGGEGGTSWRYVRFRATPQD